MRAPTAAATPPAAADTPPESGGDSSSNGRPTVAVAANALTATSGAFHRCAGRLPDGTSEEAPSASNSTATGATGPRRGGVPTTTGVHPMTSRRCGSEGPVPGISPPAADLHQPQ